MKKLTLAVFSLGVAAIAVSCGNSDAAKNTVADSTGVATDATPAVNIRYIDEDSISANYNLAKDFKEASIAAFSRLEAAQQQKTREIQNFGSQIESKMKSNGYLSEQSYQADMTKFQKMQQDAQNYLANMQRSTEMELAQQQQQLQDSLSQFLIDYNKEKKYDAILFKAAGAYFNPALDITSDVIKGLNERYNKVADKK